MRMTNKKILAGPELRRFLDDADVSLNLASKIAGLAQSTMSRLAEKEPQNMPRATAEALLMLFAEVEKNRCADCKRYLPPKGKRKRG